MHHHQAARRAGARVRRCVLAAAAAFLGAATAVSAQPLRDAEPYLGRPAFSLPKIPAASTRPVPAATPARQKAAIFHSTPSKATTLRMPTPDAYALGLAPTDAGRELLAHFDDGAGLVRYQAGKGALTELPTANATVHASEPGTAMALRVAASDTVDLKVPNKPFTLARQALPAGTLLVLDGTSGAQQVRALDVVTGAELTALPLRSATAETRVGLAVNPERGTLLSLSASANALIEIDAADGTELARWPLAPAGTPPFAAGLGDVEWRASSGRIWVVGDAAPLIREFTAQGRYVRDLSYAGFVQDKAGAIDSATGLAAIPGSAEVWMSGYQAIYRFDPEAPVIESFTAEVLGGQTTLKWRALNAEDCTASEGWAGKRALSGEQATPAVRDRETPYTLTCGDGERADSREVVVAAATSAGFIGADANQYRVSEDGGSVTVFMSRTGDTLGAVSVDYATQDSNAQAGLDYEARSGTLSWADGDFSGRSVSIPILDDNLSDPNELITFALSNPQGGAQLNNGGATILIDENGNAGVVQLEASVLTVPESAGSVVLKVVRSRGSRGAISVDFETQDGSAQAGLDYTSVNGTLSWADGDFAPKTITLPIIADLASEPLEAFGVVLSNPDNGARLGQPSSTAVFIDEGRDSAGVVQFTTSGLTVPESVGVASIEVVRTRGSRGAISVSYSAQDSSAIAGSDYTAVSGTLNWADGEMASKFIQVPITDDLLTDPDEGFSMLLSNPTGEAQLGGTQSVFVVIDENRASAGIVLFAAGSQTVSEAVGFAAIEVVRSRGSRGAISVDYATQDSSAVAPADYSAVAGTLAWADGDMTPKTILVPIVNDLLTDPDEGFSVLLSNPGNEAQLGLNNTFIVLDESRASAGIVQFASGSQRVSEAVGSATIQVVRARGSRGAISVDYTTQDSSAQAGIDYAAVSGSLTWADGDMTPKTILVPIVDDLLTDPDEGFALLLSNPGGEAQLGSPTSTFIGLDESLASAGFVQFTTSGRSVSEAAGSVVIQVVRARGSRGAVSVDYTTVDSNAQAGLDYTATSGSLNWAAGDVAPKTITVPIAADAVADPGEGFVLQLSNPANGVQLGSPSSVFISLEEPNAGPTTLGFDRDQYTVDETAGTVTITVRRAGSSSGAVSVDYQTFNGSAAVVDDYTERAGQLSWANGDSSPKSFTVAIVNDNLTEADETFTVQLSNPLGGAQLDRPFASATILERNGGGVLGFATGQYTVTETVGALLVSVTRSNGSNGAVSVDYATSGFQAQSGLDYAETTGTLTWTHGDTAAKTFTVPITDDNQTEADESLFVQLSNPTGGAQISQGFALVTILDGRGGGLLSFTADRYVATETGSGLVVTVSRTGGSSGPVSVDYATSGFQALAGLDYTEAAGTLTWANGETAPKTFLVPITDDNLTEFDEQFFVQLANATGGAQIVRGSALANIIDGNGGGVLSLAANQYLTTETGGGLTITVTRTGGSLGTVSVDYATSGFQAQQGIDYIETTGSLIWADGDTAPKIFTIPIVDDNTTEADELFFLQLTNPTGGAQTSRASATVVIAEGDGGGVLDFSANAYAVSETEGALIVTVNRNGGSRGAVSVDYGVSGFQAQASADFTETAGALNWADGDDAPKTFVIPILDDNLSETEEVFFISLSNATGGARINGGSVQATILDHGGGGVLSFASDGMTVSESGGSVTLAVVRNGGRRGPVAIDYATRQFNNAVAGEDYASSTGTLTWTDGDRGIRNITIPIVDDVVTEGNESFIVELSNPTGGAQGGNPLSSIVTIREQASAGVVQFDPTAYRISEDGGSVIVTAIRSGGRLGAVSVGYTTEDGSAQAGSDYQARSGTLTWADGDLAPKSFTVPLIASLLNEPDEQFLVRLRDPLGGVLVGASSVAVVTLFEPQNPGVVQFDAAVYLVDEGAGSATITVTRSGGSFGAGSARVITGGGSATAGSDYTAVSQIVSWASGDSAPKTVSIPIQQDTIDESDETIELALVDITGIPAGSPITATLNLVDDDESPGFVQLETPAYSATEGSGSATIRIFRLGGAGGAASVRLVTGDGTAMAGSDYEAVSQLVSWADGDATPRTVDVPVLQDLLDEPDETVALSLIEATGATLGSPASGQLTLIDDDDAPGGSVQLSSSTYSVGEGGGSAIVTLTRTGGSFGAASAQVSTGNGTAAAGSDYTALSQVVNWADGDSASKTVSVLITQDLIDEPNETLNLALSAVTGAELGSPSAATLTIVDDDDAPAGSVQLSAATYSVNEGGGSAVITLTRTGGSFGAASAQIATSNGTATAGFDYTALSQVVNWADGDAASKTVSVSITQDLTDEPNETVNLALSAVTGAALGSPSAATLTIIDDDNPPSGSVQLSAATYSINEGGGSAILTLTRSGGSFGAASVQIATSNGSATAGADYTTVSQPVSWADGDAASKTVSVPIIQDLVDEPNESLNLMLSAAAGATLGAPSSAVLTIIDDDEPAPALPILALTLTPTTIAEGGGTAIVRLRLSRPTTVAVRARITYDSRARKPRDLSRAPTYATIRAGQTETSFEVRAANDRRVEPDEQVVLTVREASNATVGAGTAVLTILDND